MAGHSKWANIQHRKKAQDAKRGKLFTKLIREITVAARQGGGDPDANPRLRTAIDKALAANMARDTVERAAKRGAGELDGATLEEVRYEGYAPGGVAVMVDCVTDNRNRTVAEVRHAFNRAGGSLGTEGSVAFQFEHRGVLMFLGEVDYEALFEAAIEAGAEDVVEEDGTVEVLTSVPDYPLVHAALVGRELNPEVSELTMRPQNTVDLSLDDSRTVMALVEALEDLDDVQAVYTNASFSEEVLADIA
ncbi:MAG: YebC/PmpR family DNA-binding transcriptional regulator [Pseudomonadota bacterium]|nr:YebC/PmpR family DNA-binding transcriptional regulator [Pseudomonadota bacterium]